MIGQVLEWLNSYERVGLHVEHRAVVEQKMAGVEANDNAFPQARFLVMGGDEFLCLWQAELIKGNGEVGVLSSRAAAVRIDMTTLAGVAMLYRQAWE